MKIKLYVLPGSYSRREGAGSKFIRERIEGRCLRSPETFLDGGEDILSMLPERGRIGEGLGVSLAASLMITLRIEMEKAPPYIFGKGSTRPYTLLHK